MEVNSGSPWRGVSIGDKGAAGRTGGLWGPQGATWRTRQNSLPEVGFRPPSPVSWSLTGGVPSRGPDSLPSAEPGKLLGGDHQVPGGGSPELLRNGVRRPRGWCSHYALLRVLCWELWLHVLSPLQRVLARSGPHSSPRLRYETPRRKAAKESACGHSEEHVHGPQHPSVPLPTPTTSPAMQGAPRGNS